MFQKATWKLPEKGFQKKKIYIARAVNVSAWHRRSGSLNRVYRKLFLCTQIMSARLFLKMYMKQQSGKHSTLRKNEILSLLHWENIIGGSSDVVDRLFLVTFGQCAYT